MSAKSFNQATTGSLDDQGFELLSPPHTLRRRALVAGGPEVVLSLIKKAEKALSQLTRHFDTWMRAESDRLVSARDRYLSTSDEVARREFYLVVHDIRSNSAGFGYPLAARIANNLGRALEEIEKLPMDVVERHVAAIRAVVREGVKSSSNEIGLALAAELERMVDAMLPSEPPKNLQ